MTSRVFVLSAPPSPAFPFPSSSATAAVADLFFSFFNFCLPFFYKKSRLFPVFSFFLSFFSLHPQRWCITCRSLPLSLSFNVDGCRKCFICLYVRATKEGEDDGDQTPAAPSHVFKGPEENSAAATAGLDGHDGRCCCGPKPSSSPPLARAAAAAV